MHKHEAARVLVRHSREEMKSLTRRTRLAWCAFGVTAMVLCAARWREPVSQGRSLTSWLEELEALEGQNPIEADWGAKAPREWEARHQRATAAVRDIGVRALPGLLRRLRDAPQPSPLLDKAQHVLDAHSPVNLHIPRRPDFSYQALLGFRALGPMAMSALPELGRLLLQPAHAEAAGECLDCLFPAALPSFAGALTNSCLQVQSVAMWHLVRAAPRLGPALLPVLMDAGTNPACQVHARAMMGLGDLGSAARQAAPSARVDGAGPEPSVGRSGLDDAEALIDRRS